LTKGEGVVSDPIVAVRACDRRTFGPGPAGALDPEAGLPNDPGAVEVWSPVEVELKTSLKSRRETASDWPACAGVVKNAPGTCRIGVIVCCSVAILAD
jgi:hypothetical protein